MELRRTLIAWVAGAGLACLCLPVLAAGQPGSLQGKTLFGEPMYTVGTNPVNVAPDDVLLRAVAEAKAAYETELSVDSATWYGRLLGYQGLMRESVGVYTTALAKFPDSAKLLRHRAHREFSLRQFDASIVDGLKAAALYEGKPLEREKLGPAYFPSTPDVVQFYAYYHLGLAYFAKHDFTQATEWFDKARQVAAGVDDAASVTAATYWQYLSLARGHRHDAARELLRNDTTTLLDLADNVEANYYFDGIQLFKNLRDPATYYDDKDSGKAFSTADAMSAGTGYSLANYYLLRGETAKAREYLEKPLQVATWSYFSRIQAEADWIALFGTQRP